MGKRIGMALILIIVLVFSAFCIADSNESYKEFRKKIFIIDIKLKDPELVPQIVQYAMFNTDPVSMFKDQVRRSRITVGSDRRSEIEFAWNDCFKIINGDMIYLLTERPLIDSTFIESKYWITTKMVKIAQKPVCWCVAVEGKKGAECQVVFSKDNRIDLEKVYDEALNELK